MSSKKQIIISTVINVLEIVLSLVSYILFIYFDPLKVSDTQSLSSLPSFFITIIIMILGNLINTAVAMHSYSEKLNIIKNEVNEGNANIIKQIKENINVTKVGYPEEAFGYIISKLNNVEEIKNTSFTVTERNDDAKNHLYDTEKYINGLKSIKKYVTDGGIWHDVGDNNAASRFRKIYNNIFAEDKEKNYKYQFKLIESEIPQINFTIITYKNKSKEVLFNWDYKTAGKEPIVVSSRDREMIDMFTYHFEYLEKVASLDHDSMKTKSVSR